jgi:hypothetical protein
MAQTTTKALAFALAITLAAMTGSSVFAASVGGRGTGNQGSHSASSHDSSGPHLSDIATYPRDYCFNRCPPRPRPRIERPSRCSDTTYRGERLECRRENLW